MGKSKRNSSSSSSDSSSDSSSSSSSSSDEERRRRKKKKERKKAKRRDRKEERRRKKDEEERRCRNEKERGKSHCSPQRYHAHDTAHSHRSPSPRRRLPCSAGSHASPERREHTFSSRHRSPEPKGTNKKGQKEKKGRHHSPKPKRLRKQSESESEQRSQSSNRPTIPAQSYQCLPDGAEVEHQFGGMLNSEYAEIKAYLTAQTIPENVKYPGNFKRKCEAFHLSDGRLHQISPKTGQHRLVLRTGQVRDAIERSHVNEGVHERHTKCFARVSRNYFWPSTMDKDIRYVLKSCIVCKKSVGTVGDKAEDMERDLSRLADLGRLEEGENGENGGEPGSEPGIQSGARRRSPLKPHNHHSPERHIGGRDSDEDGAPSEPERLSVPVDRTHQSPAKTPAKTKRTRAQYAPVQPLYCITTGKTGIPWANRMAHPSTPTKHDNTCSIDGITFVLHNAPDKELLWSRLEAIGRDTMAKALRSMNRGGGHFWKGLWALRDEFAHILNLSPTEGATSFMHGSATGEESRVLERLLELCPMHLGVQCPACLTKRRHTLEEMTLEIKRKGMYRYVHDHILSYHEPGSSMPHLPPCNNCGDVVELRWTLYGSSSRCYQPPMLVARCCGAPSGTYALDYLKAMPSQVMVSAQNRSVEECVARVSLRVRWSLRLPPTEPGPDGGAGHFIVLFKQEGKLWKYDGLGTPLVTEVAEDEIGRHGNYLARHAFFIIAKSVYFPKVRFPSQVIDTWVPPSPRS